MENWLPIQGYEGVYEVSNFGNIRSVKTTVPCLMKLNFKKNGYVYICLSDNNKKNHFRVHRVVAIAFISNPGNKSVVNHKDGDKANNKVENLEWVTSSENDIHAYKNGLRVSPKVWTGKKGADHNRSVKVIQQDLSGNFIEQYDSSQQAKMITGIPHQNIIKVCRGQRATAGGFKWEYGN
jgi:hypothetical protein